VFDGIAQAGGCNRLAEVMTMADPRAALDRMVEIFCAFWSRDPAVGRLNEAMVLDPEFAEAVRERNERRRRVSRCWSTASRARARRRRRARMPSI